MVAPRGKSQAQTRAEDRIAAVRNAASRRGTTRKRQDDIPDVYQEMLSEAESSADPHRGPSRLSKKRRLEDDFKHMNGSSAPASRQMAGSSTHSAPTSASGDGSDTENQARPQQTVEDSADSDDEDIDWEEIGFDNNEPPRAAAARLDDDIADVSVEVGPKKTPKKTAAMKRKPVTTAEKLMRMSVHEAHVLFLLFHVHVRNSWCNREAVQSRLKSFLPSKNIGMLHPKSDIIQFSRSEKFFDGLKLAVGIWRAKFRVIESGMHKSLWADGSDDIQQQISSISDDIRPIDKGEFLKRASTLAGSQDLGNQLFCALLRSVGVEARLVCSLQPLPFGAGGTKAGTSYKGKRTVYAADFTSDGGTSAEEGSANGSATGSATEASFTPSGRRRKLGRPNFAISGTSVAPPKLSSKPVKKSNVRRLEYPIFWVEAFDEAYQRWVPIDATVTGTVNKPAKLEPPASYDQNAMSYVVAFDEHGHARDVTRRYAKAYNAKTRKIRIESTETGERWWRKALKSFRSRIRQDRDQVEDAELSKKEGLEGLPNNMQDFKDHPYYALERHLKRHEVIFPKRAVGKVNAGKSSSSNAENVYRRNDVQLVRSADKWYRVGREIKPSQQPLKHVPARRGLRERDDPDEEAPMTALYAYSQTSLYIPPPVVSGQIPKNAYGNLDVYVPSMIPPGAVHVKHALAARAAKLLGIDYADAVTGFKFKGRIGEAVKVGVVVASEYGDAVESVVAGFENAAQEAEDLKRSMESLRLWRRFLTGLRIGVRLGLYESGKVETGKAADLRKEMDKAEENEEEAMGGFFPDTGEETVPTAHAFKPALEPRSLLARAQDELDKSDPEDKEASEDSTEVFEEAPRVWRQRKATTENNDAEDSAKPMVQAGRPGKSLLKDSDMDDDSEDEFVPETVRPTPSRRRRGKGNSTPAGIKPDITIAQSTLRRSTRQTRAQKKLAEESTSEEDLTTAPAHETTQGSLSDIEHVEVDRDLIPEAYIDQEEQYGGGFIPDDTISTHDAEEMCGGFIPEDAEMDSQPRPAATGSGDASDWMQGGGFIPDDLSEMKIDHGTSSRNLSTTNESMQVEGVFLTSVAEARDAVGEKGLSDEPLNQRDQAYSEISDSDRSGMAARRTRPDEHEDDVMSNGSRSSLLSHDPEDEDAEPEWLNSD